MNRSEQARAWLRRRRSRLSSSVTGMRTGGQVSDESLVWVMGSPRTGSTWLTNMLAWITGAAMVDEPLIGTHLATPLSAITARPGGSQDGLVSDAFADREDYFFSEAHADTWVPALRDLVVLRLRAGVPAGERPPLVLVKEPNGSLGAPMLLRCLPQSRLLFLVRDGRDVVDSVLDGVDGGWMGENFGLDLDQYGGRRALLARRAERWVQDTAAVRRAFDDHAPSRRMLVRYEDLLEAPVDRVAELLDWLGRPTPADRIREAVDLLDRGRVPADQQGRGKFVRAATPGLWAEHFDAEEQSLLEEIMGPTLRALGYRLRPEGPTER